MRFSIFVSTQYLINYLTTTVHYNYILEEIMTERERFINCVTGRKSTEHPWSSISAPGEKQLKDGSRKA